MDIYNLVNNLRRSGVVFGVKGGCLFLKDTKKILNNSTRQILRDNEKKILPLIDSNTSLDSMVKVDFEHVSVYLNTHKAGAMAPRTNSSHQSLLSGGKSIPDRHSDPRADLAQDHDAWVSVLTTAYHEDRELWGLLHGFRCCGCKLTSKPSGRLRLNLDLVQMIDSLGEDTKFFKDRWLDPNRGKITNLFLKCQN